MKVIITSGGTREKIDPVRYIGNYSSDRMGTSLANAFAAKGADVTVISGAGEVHYKVPVVKVESADDMLAASLDSLPCDIFIAAAAVADKKPKYYYKEKIKKSKLKKILLVPNPDIVAAIGKHETQRPKLVIGFAAESENHIKNARRKLTKKSCDLIVLNDITALGSDENEVWLVSKTSEVKLEKADKQKIAEQIVEYILNVIPAKN